MDVDEAPEHGIRLGSSWITLIGNDFRFLAKEEDEPVTLAIWFYVSSILQARFSLDGQLLALCLHCWMVKPVFPEIMKLLNFIHLFYYASFDCTDEFPFLLVSHTVWQFVWRKMVSLLILVSYPLLKCASSCFGPLSCWLVVVLVDILPVTFLWIIYFWCWVILLTGYIKRP